MINNIKNIISPWIDNLNKDKIEEKYINPPSISIYIESISNKTNDLFKNILPNNKITSFIKKYINDVKNLINKILEKIGKKKESKVIDDITLHWEICRNKVLDILNNDDIENEILNNENDIKLRRWPLFIMLFAAIVCLGFSASFHLFGTMSKNIYQIMSRLDYAGITFLIAGSCFPPYFYFFYCESCKNIFFNFFFIILIFYSFFNCLFKFYFSFFI
jgi:adiponectin receptor